MSKQQKPKVVNIDAHIKKSTKQAIPAKVPGKRGRPTNASKLAGNSGNEGTDTTTPRIISSHGEPNSAQQSTPTVSPAPVVVAFDTTAQAKGFIQGPFAIVAMILSDNDMALTEQEADLITPVFKPIYDEDILPMMGKNSKYVNLGAILAGVIGKKFMLYRAKHANDKKPTYHVEPVTVPDGYKVEGAEIKQTYPPRPSGAQAFPGIPTELVK